MPSRRALGVLVFLLLAGPAAAQDPFPRFEVATLKISPPPTADAISVNLGAFRNGCFTFANVTLSDAVMYAFDLPSKELLAGIDWQDSVRFDVVALAPAAQFPGRINHKRMPMGLLASLLSRFEHQLVVDQTGLSGLYEVRLEWTPDVVVPPGDAVTAPPDRPNLYTAVREQLGLRLEGRRGPLDVVVVTSASKTPSEN